MPIEPDSPDLRIIILGGGQAAASAAESLRRLGHKGPITMVAAEAHLPYQRPPLSKDILATDAPVLPVFRPETYWKAQGVNLVLANPALRCAVADRSITLQDGRRLVYDRLLVATGARPRRLEMIEGRGLPIHYLRTFDDALALRSALVPGGRVAIVGGGVIGLEVASAAVKRGCSVEVLEAGPRLLARALPEAVSSFMLDAHRSHGVRFHFDARIAGATSRALVLADGGQVAADLAVVGVGVDPCVETLAGLGLDDPRGVEVDVHCMTSVAGVFAAGDVTRQYSPWHDAVLRIESYANAQDQGACAAANMLGTTQEYRAAPWFWSDQYQINLQVLGNPLRGTLHHRGTAGDGRFSLASYEDGRLFGAVTVNNGRDMAVLRRLVAAGRSLEPERFVALDHDLRQALA